MSKNLKKLSRIIFSGQTSDGTMYTDQGKRPDQITLTKTRTTIQNHPKKNKEKSIEKKADDEPFHRQEVKIL